eukprot:gene32412-51441_t
MRRWAALSLLPAANGAAWDGVPSPEGGWDAAREGDWIGVYSPPDAADLDYVPRAIADGGVWLARRLDPGAWGTGSGAANLSVVNMRDDYEFRYVRTTTGGGGPSVRALARSARLRFAAGPHQVHLAGTGDPTTVRVLWTDAAAGRPRVVFGERGAGLNRTAYGGARTYGARDMRGAAAISSA